MVRLNKPTNLFFRNKKDTYKATKTTLTQLEKNLFFPPEVAILGSFSLSSVLFITHDKNLQNSQKYLANTSFIENPTKHYFIESLKST